MKPKVSVIVPIYNVETYLKTCVESISNQSMREIEIILIDDGSSDKSPSICDQFAATDSRIRSIHQTNAGVSAARNLGIQLARGEWIMFVDSDDWLEPNAIELLYNKSLMVSCEIVVASYYRNYIRHQERNGPQIEESCVFSVNEFKRYLLGTTLAEPLLNPNLFPTEMRSFPFSGFIWARIYKRQIIIDNKIVFPVEIKYSEDIMFTIEMISCSSRVCVISTPIYHYRMRASSICHASLEGQYLHTNGHAMIDWLASYETQIDKIYIQRFAIKFTCEFISKFFHKRTIQDLKQLSTGILLLLEQHPICEQAIRSSSYKIMSGGKDKLKLWLLKRRMYNAIGLVYILYHKFIKNRKNLEPYP